MEPQDQDSCHFEYITTALQCNKERLDERTYCTKPHFNICRYLSLSDMDEPKHMTVNLAKQGLVISLKMLCLVHSISMSRTF